MRYTERWIKSITHPWIVPIYVAFVVVCYFFLDKPLAWKMHELQIESHYPIVTWLTQFGKSIYWLTLLPVVGLFFRHGWRVKQMEWRIWFLWSTVILVDGVCFVLKNLLGRARPELLFSEGIFGFFGPKTNGLYHSFPSGHTTQMTVIVLSLSLLYPRWRWLWVGFGVVILITRILLTKHYLSDVLASILLVIFEYRLFLYIVAQQCPLYWKKLGVK